MRYWARAPCRWTFCRNESRNGWRVKSRARRLRQPRWTVEGRTAREQRHMTGKMPAFVEIERAADGSRELHAETPFGLRSPRGQPRVSRFGLKYEALQMLRFPPHRVTCSGWMRHPLWTRKLRRSKLLPTSPRPARGRKQAARPGFALLFPPLRT